MNINLMRLTGRKKKDLKIIKKYCKEQYKMGVNTITTSNVVKAFGSDNSTVNKLMRELAKRMQFKSDYALLPDLY